MSAAVGAGVPRAAGSSTLKSIAVAVACSFLGALCAAAAAVAPRTALLILLFLLIPAPILVRAHQQRLDAFEPVVLLTLGLAALFLARPLAHLGFHDMYFRNFRVDAGFNRALAVAAVGIGSLYAGYASQLGTRLANHLPRAPELDHRVAGPFAIGLVVLGVLLFGAFLASAGSFRTGLELLRGRTITEGAIYGSASAYFYWGIFLAIPACLIAAEAGAVRLSIVLKLIAAATAVFVVVITGPRGDRLWLMALVVGLIALPYLRSGRRPRTAAVGVALVVAVLIGVFLGQVRDVNNRRGPATSIVTSMFAHPSNAAKSLVLGPDIEMFSTLSLAVERIPSQMPHQPGVTITSLVANPVPRAFWPNKPVSADRRVFEVLFPAQASVSPSGTAESYFGGLFYDSGWLGVVLGALIFGIGARCLWEWFRLNAGRSSARLMFASALPLMLILLRGNPTDTSARALMLVGPVVAYVLLFGRSGASTAHDRAQST